MADNIRQMIKEINDGKNLEEYLPQYANKYMYYNYQYSLLRLTMDYYILYEIISEGENSYINQTKDMVGFINGIIGKVFSKEYKIESSAVVMKELDAVRNEIIKKMQILTSYTDKLQIYEYVLNRKEFIFKEELLDINEDVFVRKLIHYIFDSKDNVVINENIKEVVGQLPIRMTKTKYFDLIKESLSVYIGSDKSSVESYIYMLKTSGMLHHPDGEREHFLGFSQLLQELEETNFNGITKEKHRNLFDRIQVAAEEITDITDLFVRLQEIVNNLYTFVLSESYIMEPEKEVTVTCKEIIIEINQLFGEEQYKKMPESLEEKLYVLEGQQEKVYSDSILFSSLLNEIQINHYKLVESLMLGKIFERLYLIEKLLSPSIFIDLGEKQNQEQADETYINQIIGGLILELTALFKNNQQCVNRAVMANTISKMPIFFDSSENVVQYIKNSMELCHDQAEKYACIHILNEIMSV
jgi:hypothetical protein